MQLGLSANLGDRRRIQLGIVAVGFLVLTVTAWAARSAPTDRIVWRGNYETGNWAQWGIYHVQTTEGARADIESDTVRQGKYAARFTTPPFDGQGERSRSQIYLDPGSTYGNAGQENWLAWSTMIGPGSRMEKGGWNNLTSFHQKDGHNTCPAPDHFAVTNTRGIWTLRLDSSGGHIDLSSCRSTSERSWTFGRIRTGIWYDIVFHVKWSPDPRVGFVEAWVNDRHVLPRTRAATLYEGDGVYLKQGYDGGGADGSTTVYNDGTVIARSYAAAAAALRSR